MFKEALTYDDVLLVPQKSNYSPRKVSVKTQLTRRIFLDIPLMSAPMDTVTESKMAIALAQSGGIGIIHKNMSVAKQITEIKKVKSKKLLCGAAISVGKPAIEHAKKLTTSGVDVIVIDVAHGHFYKVAQTIKTLKRNKAFKKIDIIGGNVATAAATRDLIKAGADAVKVGVGPGSICTTRVIAGIGIPQLTAVINCAKAAKDKVPIIADGGIRFSGDITKALAGGANAVMIGVLFAETEESPGEVIIFKGKKCKIYRGMGSINAMEQGSKDRYMQSDKKGAKAFIAEGVEGIVEYKGSVKDVIYQLIGGLKQGLGYCGTKDIKSLQKRAEFIRITHVGLAESHPHGLITFKENPNYSIPKEDKFL